MFSNRKEFIDLMKGRNFVVLDQGFCTEGFWAGSTEVEDIEGATVYKGDFNTQEEFDSFNRRHDVKAVLIDQ